MVDPVSFSDGICSCKNQSLTTPRHSLRALVAKRDFNEIEEISKTRKSPIGWEVSPYQPSTVPIWHN